MANKKYKVAIYNNHGGTRFHTNRPLAYLKYYTSSACFHEVIASSGIEAKRIAIHDHLYNLSGMCSHVDEYCHGCPGVGARL